MDTTFKKEIMKEMNADLTDLNINESEIEKIMFQINLMQAIDAVVSMYEAQGRSLKADNEFKKQVLVATTIVTNK